MSVMRYEPWILMNRMQRDFDRLLKQNSTVSEEQRSALSAGRLELPRQ